MSLYFRVFFRNSRLIRSIKKDKIAKLSATLTITPECFLCLCEALIYCYSCMGDYADTHPQAEIPPGINPPGQTPA